MTAIHTENYPASYYFSSKHYQNEYATLTESVEADVCIVGGGYSGIASAVELAERGYNVVVLEAKKIGWGASGRNGGQLIRGIGHDLNSFRKIIGQEGIDVINGMGNEASKILIDRIEKYNIDCDLTMGYCDLANKAKHVKVLEQDYEDLLKSKDSHQFRLLDKDQLKNQIIGSDNFIAGLEDKGSGHLHPLNLCLGEAQAAMNLGVEIYENSMATGIVYGDNIVVTTDKGQVKAKQLILAGNAYLSDLAPKLSSKILPAGSYIIATEPLPEDLWRQLLPGNHAVCDMKIVLDYFRLSADKRLLFGGMCNYSGRDPKDIKSALFPKMLKVFPQLANVKIDFQWGGMVGIGANRLPQIGRFSPNVYYAQAYSGHGVNVTHMAAKLIAEAIDGQTNRIEVFDQVKHMNFPGGKHFRSPIMALGMAYHLMLDMF